MSGMHNVDASDPVSGVRGLDIEDIRRAFHTVQEVTVDTPLTRNAVLSDRYNCNVYLKREDLQRVRSFKIRGAYNFLRNLSADELMRGVVCASAGNHAQGVAYSCRQLEVHGSIFMPTTTPRQKVSQVKLFGASFVDVHLIGDTFDDAYVAAIAYCDEKQRIFVHPFNDPLIAAGQGTVGIEIINQMDAMKTPVDFVFMSIGGGGLISGVGSYVKAVSPYTKVIGAEPAGAPSMKRSFEAGKVVALEEIDKFVDGAAVKQVGQLTYEVCREVVDDIVIVPEGKTCTTILELYNENAIVAEPAGAMPIAALDFYRDEIVGKNVVCVVSGGNNDIDRMQEIKERSLIYEGLMHYFLIQFPQRAGALREFIDLVVGSDDDITRFEYIKKNNKENGPALVGIELKQREDYASLMDRMRTHGISYMEINRDPALFQLLI
ncbi:threonine ammonia-lyase IlvA [Alicyclobacillus sp. ALC3]|uniref:threonine ammonia-lyase IlvA n=1 Tax=Alicyclobacillus sp. ALC3 TaxID=2796143 RepID=UPI00237817FC|nr:threonine ammonia-lyase IlvA [Alicyclobacillus sp. ALC3]